jgi:tetratricopeptide (TPR) repeat protein
MIMKDIFRTLLIIFMITLSTVGYCIAQDNSEILLKFANTLFEDQEYYRAVTEYYRFIKYYPEDNRVVDAYVKIAECYFYGKQYEDAIKWSEKILTMNKESKHVTPVWFIMGDSYFKIGNYKSAIKTYSSVLKTETSDPGCFDLARMRIGKSLLYEEKWDEASEEFLKVNPDSIYFPRAKMLAERALLGNHLKRKNPAIGGLLSLIPGLGYFYTENRQTALASLIVNGLFIWGSYSSFENDNEGAGYVLGFFGVGFYLGNIYGSIGSAHKYNERQKELFLEDFK